MVLAAIGFLLVVAIYKERTGRTRQGVYQTVWGVGVVGIILSLAADFVPQLAGPFAGLVALGSLTHGGDKVLASILGTVSGQGAGSFTAQPSGTSGAGPGGATTGHATTPVGPSTRAPGSGGFGS